MLPVSLHPARAEVGGELFPLVKNPFAVSPASDQALPSAKSYALPYFRGPESGPRQWRSIGGPQGRITSTRPPSLGSPLAMFGISSDQLPQGRPTSITSRVAIGALTAGMRADGVGRGGNRYCHRGVTRRNDLNLVIYQIMPVKLRNTNTGQKLAYVACQRT
jgi:hypothetical protein